MGLVSIQRLGFPFDRTQADMVLLDRSPPGESSRNSNEHVDQEGAFAIRWDTKSNQRFPFLFCSTLSFNELKLQVVRSDGWHPRIRLFKGASRGEKESLHPLISCRIRSPRRQCGGESRPGKEARKPPCWHVAVRSQPRLRWRALWQY